MVEGAIKGTVTVWFQKEITLKSRGRGCHYITEEITKALPEISSIKFGLLNLFSIYIYIYIYIYSEAHISKPDP